MAWWRKRRDPETAQEQLRRYHDEENARQEVSSVPVISTSGGEVTVEDVFQITGRGLVATGVVATGTVRVGDQVELLREHTAYATSEIAGIETFRRKTSVAETGTNVGILLRGKHDVGRGDVIRVISPT